MLWTLAGFGVTVGILVVVPGLVGSWLVTVVACAAWLAVFAVAWRRIGTPAAAGSPTPAGTTDATPADAPETADGESTEASVTTDGWSRHLAVPEERTLLAVGSVLAGTVTVLVVTAADSTARVTGLTLVVAAFVPFAAFPLLGALAGEPDRSAARAAAVTATGVAPAVAAFAWVVGAGAEAYGPVLGTIAWGVSAALVGVVLFYAGLAKSTR